MQFSRLEHLAEINEMSFFYFSRVDGAQNFVMNDNAIGAMLLPRLGPTGPCNEAVYTCLTKDWRVLVGSSGLFSNISRHSV